MRRNSLFSQSRNPRWLPGSDWPQLPGSGPVAWLCPSCLALAQLLGSGPVAWLGLANPSRVGRGFANSPRALFVSDGDLPIPREHCLCRAGDEE